MAELRLAPCASENVAQEAPKERRVVVVLGAGGAVANPLLGEEPGEALAGERALGRRHARELGLDGAPNVDVGVHA